jgi:hypothetical protein
MVVLYVENAQDGVQAALVNSRRLCRDRRARLLVSLPRGASVCCRRLLYNSAYRKLGVV